MQQSREDKNRKKNFVQVAGHRQTTSTREILYRLQTNNALSPETSESPLGVRLRPIQAATVPGNHMKYNECE